MREVSNYPKCGALFTKTKFRDVCQACFVEEEKLFEEVYQFIRKKENRTATMEQVIEGTEVEEIMIIKFIKSGKLRIVQFPNLGYDCERCGIMIREGSLCEKCIETLKKDLGSYQKEVQRKQKEREKNRTYYTKEIE